MVVLLIAQAALAIAFFADDSWKKLLPHDDTGEAQKVRMPEYCLVWFQLNECLKAGGAEHQTS